MQEMSIQSAAETGKGKRASQQTEAVPASYRTGAADVGNGVRISAGGVSFDVNTTADSNWVDLSPGVPNPNFGRQGATADESEAQHVVDGDAVSLAQESEASVPSDAHGQAGTDQASQDWKATQGEQEPVAEVAGSSPARLSLADMQQPLCSLPASMASDLPVAETQPPQAVPCRSEGGTRAAAAEHARPSSPLRRSVEAVQSQWQQMSAKSTGASASTATLSTAMGAQGEAGASTQGVPLAPVDGGHRAPSSGSAAGAPGRACVSAVAWELVLEETKPVSPPPPPPLPLEEGGKGGNVSGESVGRKRSVLERAAMAREGRDGLNRNKLPVTKVSVDELATKAEAEAEEERKRVSEGLLQNACTRHLQSRARLSGDNARVIAWTRGSREAGSTSAVASASAVGKVRGEGGKSGVAKKAAAQAVPAIKLARSSDGRRPERANSRRHSASPPPQESVGVQGVPGQVAQTRVKSRGPRGLAPPTWGGRGEGPGSASGGILSGWIGYVDDACVSIRILVCL